MNCLPRDQSGPRRGTEGPSDLLYSWKFIKPHCNGGRRSIFAGNSALLLSHVIDFAMLSLTDFGGKQFHC